MRPYLFFVVAAIFWGLNFHLAKIMLAQVSFLEAGFWRYLFGITALLVISFRSKIKWPRTLQKEGKGGILLVGVIGLFGFNVLFFWGLEHTSALNAALIMSLNPALTLLFDHLILKNKITRHQKIGMAIAMIGVILLITKGAPQKILELQWSLGDILILAANSIFALHHIWVKLYGSYLPNSTFTLLTNGICFFCFLLVLPVTGSTALTNTNSYFWLAAFGTGIPGTALAYLFWNKGVLKLGAIQAGFYMNLVPLAAALLSILFKEQLYPYHFFSGAIILFGMIWLNLDESR